MAKKLKVTLVKSGINRDKRHKETVLRLGLRKMHKSSILPDNLSVRGMIRTVAHLVTVESAD